MNAVISAASKLIQSKMLYLIFAHKHSWSKAGGEKEIIQ